MTRAIYPPSTGLRPPSTFSLARELESVIQTIYVDRTGLSVVREGFVLGARSAERSSTDPELSLLDIAMNACAEAGNSEGESARIADLRQFAATAVVLRAREGYRSSLL